MPDGMVTPYSARPTLRIDGQRNDRVDAQIIELLLREQVGGLSSLQVRLTNSVRGVGVEQHGFGDEKIFKLGTELRLYGGSVTAPCELFRGRVSALEVDLCPDRPATFVVLAEDSLQKARCSRRSASYENASRPTWFARWRPGLASRSIFATVSTSRWRPRCR